MTFGFCKSLTEITIPDGVTSIGEVAFKLCEALTNIEIPDDVTKIGSETFYGCSNLTITYKNISYAYKDYLYFNDEFYAAVNG